ncbi:unnamed protein product [Caenorhabditis bovis]|uniref:Anaphase-promoting complex subunit 4-like WD40 domain-containing protein n=1 Tax=Caenorhabditis bovis TaxID=2654633 RepID=A0A8S1F9U5_9PELO|nr:unnamed protein product [Caenorhabditis bovis]
MVVLDDSLMEEDEVDFAVKMVAKYERAHSRPITGLWSFRFAGQIAFITIAHDSAKLWTLDEDRHRKQANISEKMSLAKWRHAVQSADVSADGKYVVAIGIDSMVHEIELENDVVTNVHDFGYMDAVYVSIASTKNTYITASFSGFLSEIEVGSGKVFRKQPHAFVKNISCLKYSSDMKFLAVGQTDGGIEMHETSTLKSIHKYEVHSMRIRQIVFLPGDERFLSACDDRLIKLHTLAEIGQSDSVRTVKPIRVFSAHDSPVLCLSVDERSGGTRFASSSASGQIFIWHIELSAPICAVPSEHNTMIYGLSFSPSGRHLISAGQDSTICCYCVPPSGEQSPIQSEDEEMYSQRDTYEQSGMDQSTIQDHNTEMYESSQNYATMQESYATDDSQNYEYTNMPTESQEYSQPTDHRSAEHYEATAEEIHPASPDDPQVGEYQTEDHENEYDAVA